jgi:adenosylhomocysteine nucleosidase
MFGIIGAMKIEIDMIISKMEDVEEVNFGIRTFYVGSYNEKEIVIVEAGIGKVNAAVTTTLMIENFEVDYIINIGVAGGQHGVKHKDVIISDYVLYHDVDVTSYDAYIRGQVPGHEPLFEADQTLVTNTRFILEKLDIDFKVGKIASGDQFVTNPDTVKEINEIYNDIYAIEMEAGAIAHVATIYKVPFIVYRSISDVIGDENQENDFYKFVAEAAENASIVLSELLKTL